MIPRTKANSMKVGDAKPPVYGLDAYDSGAANQVFAMDSGQYSGAGDWRNSGGIAD